MLDRNVTPAFRRLLKREFPELDFKTILRLMRMGLLRLPKHVRCGAWAKSRGRPCLAQAIPNGTGRCRNHGGLSTGCKSELGRSRISEAQKVRWAKWREERGSSCGKDQRH
jgi:hypothetical protein